MTDVRAYLHYFQTLAKEHGHINDFFVMDINEPLTAMRSQIAYPALIMNSLHGKFLAPNLDNILDEVTGGFLIIGRVAKVNDFSAEMLLLQQMKEIGTDIIARMNRDLKACEPRAQKAILGFTLNSVSYQMVDGIFDNCFGFLFTFKIHAAMVFEYNPLKWASVKTFPKDFQY